MPIAHGVTRVVGSEDGGGWLLDGARVRRVRPDDTLEAPVVLPGLDSIFDADAFGDALYVVGYVPYGPHSPRARFRVRHGAAEVLGRSSYNEHLDVVTDAIWALSETGVERLDGPGSLPLERRALPTFVGVDAAGALYSRRGGVLRRVFPDGHRVRIQVPGGATVVAVPDGRPLLDQ